MHMTSRAVAQQSLKIVGCDDSHRDAWNACVSETGGSFYHRFEWKAINEACLGHQGSWLAALDGSGRMVGVFPIVRIRSRLFGNIACSLPFVNYGGPCAQSPEVEDALIQEATRLAHEWHVDYLEVRSRRDLGGRFVTSRHKVSLTLQLDSDPEVLWKAFKTGHRQDIRKGYKQDVTARFGTRELLDDFYGIMSESWRDLGTPIYSKSYLARIVDAFPDSIRLCVLYAGNEPAAGAFDGLHGDTVEGMWLATRAKFRSQLVGYVLYWELIKDACTRGFRHFHMGRSSADSGAESFKRKWRADSSQLHWHYVLGRRRAMPHLNADNPKYQFAIRTWRRLPIPVTQVIGPLIARNIP